MPHFSRFSPANVSGTSAAILIALIGMLVFTASDAVAKWLSSGYSVGQLVLIRSIAALVMLSPFLWKAGARTLFVVDKPWTHVARALAATFDVFAFYFAVSYLPLADVMTYWLAAPIYVAAFAPLLLGEHVGWRRWTAIGVGFLGVIIALEPSQAMFTPSAAMSIAGSMAFGYVLLSARSLKTTPGITLIFWQSAAALIVGLCTVPFAWTTPAPGDWPLLILLGLFGMTAHMMISWAFKLADAAVIAPLQYTQLFWATTLGWFIFGDFPSLPKFIGAGLIIASGLYILFRERALKNENKVLPAVPE